MLVSVFASLQLCARAAKTQQPTGAACLRFRNKGQPREYPSTNRKVAVSLLLRLRRIARIVMNMATKDKR